MEDKYFDLDIPLKNINPSFLARIFDCGYHYVALSQSALVDDFNFAVKSESSLRKKTKEERQLMRNTLATQLEPPTSEYLQNLISESQKYRATVLSTGLFSRPRLFRRLNLHCTDPSLAGLFFREFGEMLNNFDIVSISPSSSEALGYACEQAVGLDVITIDLSKSADLRLNSKQCSAITNRGLHLEFYISPLLRFNSVGSNARIILSSYLTSLFSSCRPSFSKSIVVSSGATCGWEIRRPLSVIAMLQCLGLESRETAFCTFTRNSHALLTHGLVRSKTAHGAAVIIRLLSLPNIVTIESESKQHTEVKTDGTEQKSTNMFVD